MDYENRLGARIDKERKLWTMLGNRSIWKDSGKIHFYIAHQILSFRHIRSSVHLQTRRQKIRSYWRVHCGQA